MCNARATTLHKCAVTAARAQTVDSRPGFFVLFFDERPGYEAMASTVHLVDTSYRLN